VGIALGAVFNAFWALGTADWKTDEAWDGRLAWLAVDGGDWTQDNGHPLFVRWLFGLGQLLLGQDRWGIRLASAVAAVAAVGLIYLVGARLHTRWAGLVAAALWAFLPRALVVGSTVVAPLRGDRFGYLEPFMVVALLGATLTGWNWVRTNAWRDAVATGSLIGLAGAFKPTALVVVVPVVAAAWWSQRSFRKIAPPAVVIVVLAAAVLPLTYVLVLGADGPSHLRTLLDFQFDHARTGHPLVVDGTLTEHQPRWSHLLYQWRGMGAAACVGLAIGVAGAWTGRRRAPVAYVTAIWLSLLAFHLLSSVALPHYYLLWAPFSVLVAAMGLVELWDQTAAPRRARGGGDDGLGARWNRAPGPATALGIAALALVASGLVATWDTATIEPGDYGRLVTELEARDVQVTSVRFQGESVERYFPGTPSGQVGFTDASVPFDLLILDPRDLPLLPAGAADAARAQAQGAGLVPHQIGRLEVWYADPEAG
jgi:4-amino-4-deoxy-L-arabinose transferase-like glycosyltransferase